MIALKKTLTLMFLGLGIAWSAEAQKMELSLQQAQDYAVEHNYQARNAVIDITLAEKKTRETMAGGFPQAEASIGYTNFINLATSLIPAEFFGGKPGEYMEVQFGTKNNASVQAQVSQLVYSATLFTGLKISRVGKELTKLQLEQISQDIRQAVASSYVLCLVSEKNLELMNETITTMEALLKDSRAMQEKGFMEETDVDKLSLMLADLRTSRLNAENQIRNAYSLLKFNLGLSITDEIALTENLDVLLMATDPEGLLNASWSPAENINNRLMDASSRLARLQIDLARTEYQPVVTAFLSQTENAQRNKFNFLDFNQKWFPTTIFGVNVGIPIFSSGRRYYKVQQASLSYEKARNTQRQVNESVALGALTAKNNFQVAVETFRNKRDNFELARKIYAKDQVRYKSGVASTTDLNQTYNSLLQAQGTYLGSIMDLFTKKTEMQKAYNKL